MREVLHMGFFRGDRRGLILAWLVELVIGDWCWPAVTGAKRPATVGIKSEMEG